jgi:primosomal protein N' (replication factor Y)
MLHKGVGTQKLVSLLESLFPGETIIRADADTIKKKDWPEKIAQFASENASILVGTKSICKGFDFPKVSLVGIIWADLDFNFPDYRAGEVAFGQLLQVAGRSGRSDKFPGEVIIQSINPEILPTDINEEKYLEFLKEEREVRKVAVYPPFSHLLHIEIRNQNHAQLEQDSQAIAIQLRSQLAQICPESTLLGPATPPIEKIARQFIKTILIKAKNLASLLKITQRLQLPTVTSKILFQPRP